MLPDLIERLEQAAGPDRELDGLIWCATQELAAHWWPQYNDAQRELSTPRYTASVDAALTLVPEGWTRAVDATAPECGIEVRLFEARSRNTEVTGDHESEPIATCIAALRAISHPALTPASTEAEET